ncbi:phosphopantetheine-binding protein, partial [Okeania sp. SIO2B3]|uniref:phosphopantetheine-binding protein n=1 Tax=Okeania sp. SIO2B3 TaxID=2607784 RepID=UPI0013BFCCCB
NQENGSSQLRVLPAQKLRSYLKQKLPEYMVPLTYVLLEDLPLTANGKVDRKALPVIDFGSLSQDFVAPETATQKELAHIWVQILDLEKVGIHDNFFDLGDSLIATQIVSRICDTFEVEFPLINLFESPTIQELSNIIDNMIWADSATVSGDRDILESGEI